MSDMLVDGASGGARPLPPNDSHDEFLELCATATTGSLRAEERKRLEEHLSHCDSCREIMAQYQALVDGVIPVWGAISSEKEPSPSGWSEETAEARLFARLNESDPSGSERSFEEASPQSGFSRVSARLSSSEETLWRHMWVQFAAAVLLVAVLGLMAYRIGMRKGTDLAARNSAPAAVSSHSAGASASADTAQAVLPLTERKVDRQLEQLRIQLAGSLAEIKQLKAEQAQNENEIALARADRSRLIQDRAELSQQLQAARQNLEVAQEKLDVAVGQSSQETARNTALQRKIDQLTESAHDSEQEIARERKLLDHDRDIRELMGSRDLYIAEVYDVAKTGDTLKPFGRVFYTRGASLIFYAYDLDQQKGIEQASTFQAWGRVGPDRERAVNLGILYQDNANNKRWVLKSENPKTLAEIDAVFVTVEPHGGSTHPSGKPLLFAYLKVQPNHP